VHTNYLKTSIEIMKYIVTSMLMLPLLIGCHGKKTYGTYELVNSTNHEIQIQSFITTDLSQEVQKSIYLAANEIWESDKLDTSRGYTWPGRREIFDGDSITVVFDQIQFIGHSLRTPDHRNLFILGEYQHINDGENETIYRFTFTETDFENATQIEN